MCQLPFTCCRSASSHSTRHPRSREVQKPANHAQLCSQQLNVMTMRGGNWLFEDTDQDGSATWPKCRAAPQRSAWGRGNVCQKLTEDTKSSGWCHRTDGWVTAERPWVPWIPPRSWVSPVSAGALLLSYSAFPRGARDQKSVLSPNMLLQTWAQGTLPCSRGAVGCSGC